MKKKCTQKVVYISGPIKDVPKYWKPFEKMEDEFSAKGFIVLTPTRLPEGLTEAQSTRIRTAMIDSADAVYFLPGWYTDDASVLEHQHAHHIGKVSLYGAVDDALRYWHAITKEVPRIE